MGATGSISLIASAGQATNTLASSYGNSQALRSQGRFQEIISASNARMAELQARESLRLGDKAAGKARRNARQTISAQRAAMAANGLDPNDSGTAAAIQADTELVGELDAQTIRNNAWRQAWGYEVAASNATLQGDFASMTARNQARNTLITGGLNAANQALSGYANYRYARFADDYERTHPRVRR